MNIHHTIFHLRRFFGLTAPEHSALRAAFAERPLALERLPVRDTLVEAFLLDMITKNTFIYLESALESHPSQSDFQSIVLSLLSPKGF